ncbi:Structural maintenance of chromosomes protein 5, partial [Pseudolycoriella hygida]
MTDLHVQKLESIKKLIDAEAAVEYNRKKQRIYIRLNAELEHRITEAKEKLNNAITLLNKIKSALDDAKEKCKYQQNIASKLTDNKKPSDARNFPYKKQFDELPETLSELIDHMNELEGQQQCLRNYNPEVLTEYENLLQDIERLKDSIEESKSNQLNLDAQMDSLFEKWYDVVANVVGNINRNFANFMMLMGFAGEVELVCGHERDYADYGIAIRVKYRNDEELQCLDRFVQSGGERAVAIAAYTLSLQQMSQVPFRCVDEINQGMDPTNERRIFEMLMKETAQPGKSQFFFVTPKLLENLPYNEYVTVSIIFNGKMVRSSTVFEKFTQPMKGDNETAKKFRYNSVLYQCKAGSQQATQSKGLRASSTYKMNCPVVVRVQFTGNNLIVTKTALTHETHSCSKEIYDHYPENMRLSAEQKAQVRKLIEAVSYLTSEKDIKAIRLQMKVPRKRFTDEVLERYYDLLTPFTYRKVEDQFNLSLKLTIILTETSEAVNFEEEQTEVKFIKQTAMSEKKLAIFMNFPDNEPKCTLCKISTCITRTFSDHLFIEGKTMQHKKNRKSRRKFSFLYFENITLFKLYKKLLFEIRLKSFSAAFSSGYPHQVIEFLFLYFFRIFIGEDSFRVEPAESSFLNVSPRVKI